MHACQVLLAVEFELQTTLSDAEEYNRDQSMRPRSGGSLSMISPTSVLFADIHLVVFLTHLSHRSSAELFISVERLRSV
jgi:hypothetical protein